MTRWRHKRSLRTRQWMGEDAIGQCSRVQPPSRHMGRRLLVRTTVLSASKPARPKRSLSLHGVAPGEYDWSRPQKMHAQQGGGGGVEQVVETLYG